MRARRQVRNARRQPLLRLAATETERTSSKKPAIYNHFFTRLPALSYTKAQGNGYPTATACAHGNSCFSAPGRPARP